MQALNAGERVWLADTALLEHLPRRAAVYLARADAAPGSPDETRVVSAIEAGSHAIERLHQYRADDLPGWMSAGTAPPPLRAFARRRDSPRAQAGAPPAPAPPRATASAPIGVFVHIYYPELADALTERIRRIPRPVTLYVSTDSESKATRLRELLPEADVRVFPNRGRDLYPKLSGFDDAYANHEIVLHLHTKRSPHLSAPGGWLDHILASLLPSPEGIEAILRRFDSDPHLGMVSPTPYGPIASSYGWTVNRAIAQALTFSRGWKLPGDRGLRFPAGSMFWARPAALAPVRELDLSIDVFPEDAPLRDGSVAHALERLIGVSCAQAGLRQAFIAPTRRR